MRYCQSYLLCDRIIDFIYSTEVKVWRAFFQILQFEKDVISEYCLVKLLKTYISAETKDIIHSLYWLIVIKALKIHAVNFEWLQRFCYLLRDIKLFFTLISFSESSEIPNNIKSIDNESVSKTSTDDNSGVFDRFTFLYKIIQIIYRYLNSYQNVVNLKKVIWIESDVRKWFILRQKYLTYKLSFLTDSNEKVLNKIKRILWNLHNCPSCFFNIVNYNTVWKNVEMIFSKMKQQLFKLDIEINLIECYVIYSTLRSDQLRKKIIYFNTVSRIMINFSDVLNQCYMYGFQFNDNILDYNSDLLITIPLKEFSGLQLVSNNKDFTVLQIKNISAWKQNWYNSASDLNYFIFTQMK